MSPSTQKVKRIPTFRCTTKGCPWPKDEDTHVPWCLHIEGVEHRRDQPWHQHHPKRSQGGKQIVAILCSYCSDRVDNTPDWDNDISPGEDGKLEYILWDTKVEGGWNSPLICRPIGPAAGEQSNRERGGQTPNAMASKATPAAGSGREAGSAAAEVQVAEVTTATGRSAGTSPDTSAAAPPASPLSTAAEAPGTAVDRSAVGSSAAVPGLFTEDWSDLSDDELQLKYDTADQMQGMAFLLKCKAVHAYRENHVQAWHESWTEHAIERFNVSRRYCYAFANLWEISVSRDTNLEHVIPLTESRSLMQAIGRRSLEDGKAAMEVAVAHHAEYAEPPSVGQLEHKLGEEREPKERHECPACGADHVVRT